MVKWILRANDGSTINDSNGNPMMWLAQEHAFQWAASENIADEFEVKAVSGR